MTFADYCELEHPIIYEEWVRSENLKWDDLQVGMKMEIIYGAYTGVVWKITKKSSDYYSEYVSFKHKDHGWRPGDRIWEHMVYRKPDPDRRPITFPGEPYGRAGTMRPIYWWQRIRIPKDVDGQR